MARGFRFVLAAAIAAVIPLAALVVGAPAAASEGVGTVSVLADSGDVDAFTFDSMDATYTLGRAEDGTSTATVVETFVAVFPDYDQNRGMRRLLPDSYQGAPLNPNLVSITDENGNARSEEVESDDGVYVMTSRSGEYLHGRQTFVFTYTLENVTRYFSDTGTLEFYWDVNGVDWRQPFGTVTATVVLPAELADTLTGAMACYEGYQDASTQCPISATTSDGAKRVQAMAGPLEPFQTMTVAIAFVPGTFATFDASYFASPWGWAQAIAALLALGAIVVAAVSRRRHLRDAPGRPTIIAEYTPPRQIDALESAVLLGLTPKAIPAEVLEQAVVGSIRIVEGDRSWTGKVKLKAVLVDLSRADGDGRMLLEGLFPSGIPGEEFEFGSASSRFSTTAQAILKAANKELDRRGLRRKVPASARALPLVLTLIAEVALFVFGFAALAAFVDPLWPILAMVFGALAFIAVVALVARKPLTAEGAEVRDHLKGLREFIEWAEADRIRMLQSPTGAERVPVNPGDPAQMLKLYETLLPYAVVFGQEKEWSKHLADLYGPDNNPSWYYGTSSFNAAAFSAGIASLSASASASSSTSGGSGGGGSAGGGGGGGGGGGV
ncbi:DUF2207 domain-containing protein [Microbacterium sp. BWT-B31]|uniref:DUF2207 domain-containing protein n=1 Tax=Microbacterium sp. BWT-B31 TaxID=3232072 RepID=UPI0035290D0B